MTPAAVPPAPTADEAERRFYKMSGSGNDFVFFDARNGRPELAADAAAVAALCSRGEGVGADGVVFLDAVGPGEVRIEYRNSDGSVAALCGNATLCTARLALDLGMVRAGEPFVIRTDAGGLPARVGLDGVPSFELAPVAELAADAVGAAVGDGELRVGYAMAGVPHLVVRVADVDAVDLATRGRELRRASLARPAGANVNFVSEAGAETWRMRTFERGVEGETLACGTGAVACGAVLRAWGETGTVTRLITRSGRPLIVAQPDAPGRGPVLTGEGRLVYEGTLRDWR